MSIRRSVAIVACVLGGAACSSSTSPSTPKHSGLWVVGGHGAGSNTANGANEYTTAQLQASGAVTPAVSLSFPVTSGTNIDASGVAFDGHGNMWVANDNSNNVVEYRASQIVSSGSPTAAVTLSLPAQSFTFALAFDANGNLWVANNFSDSIVEFSASQLTTSGSPAPAVTIVEPMSQSELQEPIGLAFDATGNLWVVNNVSNSVVEYSASQLTTSGSPTPAVTLTGSALSWPDGIAFDAHGNLWVANAAYVGEGIGQGRIVEYAASQITASGSPTPATVINTPGGQFGSVPIGLAFDNAGNLWYSDAYTQGIGEYTTAQLAGAGGNLTPTISIPSTNSFGGVAIAFDPRPSGLPLH